MHRIIFVCRHPQWMIIFFNPRKRGKIVKSQPKNVNEKLATDSQIQVCAWLFCAERRSSAKFCRREATTSMNAIIVVVVSSLKVFGGAFVLACDATLRRLCGGKMRQGQTKFSVRHFTCCRLQGLLPRFSNCCCYASIIFEIDTVVPK